MNILASLYDIRQHLGLASGDTADDGALLKALIDASYRIESIAQRRFSPYQATLTQSINAQEATELILSADLLELTSISNGDGNSIDLVDVTLFPGHADVPAGVIRLINGVGFVYDESPYHAVSITGIWGFHDRWTEAWRASADTLADNPLSDNATSLSVTDADGVDDYQLSPRFQVGQLLRIESEYLRVTAVDSDTNTLTVLRGVNGTTAASHTQGTAIEIYHPIPAVRDVCIQYAEWLFKFPALLDPEIESTLRNMLGAWMRVRV